MPSSAKTSSPRRATSLGRLRPPPIPRDGGALAAPLRGDGSRGGGALRFGARYGSSDSLRKASPAGGPGGVQALGHTVARMLSRTKRTMSWVEVPGVKSSFTPMALSAVMSSAGMIPPPNTAMSSAPFSLSSSSTRAKR
jgi:hypothetical protein